MTQICGPQPIAGAHDYVPAARRWGGTARSKYHFCDREMQAGCKHTAQPAARQPTASKKHRPADRKTTTVSADCKAGADTEPLAPTDCSNFREYGEKDQRSEWESVVQQYAHVSKRQAWRRVCCDTLPLSR